MERVVHLMQISDAGIYIKQENRSLIKSFDKVVKRKFKARYKASEVLFFLGPIETVITTRRYSSVKINLPDSQALSENIGFIVNLRGPPLFGV